MSLAENLLSTLSEEHINETPSNEEEHIIIDNTRVITVPEKLKTIAVMGDKDIETVTIDCVRFWDEHDLSTFAIYINYMLPNGDTGTYIPTIINANDEYFTFNWVIGKDVTRHRGKLSFLIVAKKADDEGNLLYQWSSLLNDDCKIYLGIEVSKIPDDETTKDIITAVLENINRLDDKKLDKVTTSGGLRFYTITPTGEQALTIAAVDNIEETLMYRSASGQTEIGTPTEASHAANKDYVDNRFVNPSSSGQFNHEGSFNVSEDVIMRNQTVQGNSLIQSDAIVRGNLTVLGTTVTEEQETLSVKDAYIITNSDSTDISATMSGTVILTGEIYADGDPYAYGILYDPATDAVRLGHGWYSVNEKKFYFSYDEHLPIAVRSDSTKMVNGNFPKWNSATNSFEDSGYNDDDFVPQISGSRLEEGQSTVFVVSRNEDGVIYRTWTDVTEIDIVNESAFDIMLEEVYS